MYKARGAIRDLAGKVSLDSGLEGEDKGEKRAGDIQQKIAEVDKVVGK